ncbi:hypothetical protein OIU85_012923 [Salix viminalis]|uniref:Uncharacterized protein n=1 Tax=Salix viminalis TaxID=40686 RepID=A0A9Q0NQ91_SALVM|nr:hypothetical protein OIU85_012923 [Salix viminalis]
MLGSPQDAMKCAMEDDPDLIKEDEKQKLLQRSVSPSTPSSEFTEVPVGTMGMEPSTNTHSNPSQENAESSCKSVRTTS